MAAEISIEEISESSVAEVAALALKLWPASSYEEELGNVRRITRAESQTIFRAIMGGRSVGFIELSIRTDYVEGTSTTPVAYIEGLFVEPAFRRKGVAEHLVRTAETWGRTRNCTEIASDTGLDNPGSIAFHQALGFAEANRVVCFVRPLNRPDTGQEPQN